MERNNDQNGSYRIHIFHNIGVQFFFPTPGGVADVQNRLYDLQQRAGDIGSVYAVFSLSGRKDGSKP